MLVQQSAPHPNLSKDRNTPFLHEMTWEMRSKHRRTLLSSRKYKYTYKYNYRYKYKYKYNYRYKYKYKWEL